MSLRSRLELSLIVIRCSAAVSLSLAVTFRMPLASRSKVTSTCGSPRGAGRMFVQPEPAEYPVVGGQLPLALQHDDVHGGLVVVGGGEHLAAARRDRGVPVDDPGHHAALGLHAQRQRGDVEQQHVGDLALEHAGLDRGADRDDLVRVDGHVRVLAASEPADQLLHGRDPGRAADQDDLVDVVLGDLGVAHRLPDRAHRALDQVLR